MSETKFSVMVSLFNWMQKSKSASLKRSKFRKFLDTFCRPKSGDDYFAAIRLILPGLDRERGSYGLREHVLATCLIDALGMSRDSPHAQRLLNWRKGGPKSGAFAGNFSLVAAEVLQCRQGMTSGGLTIKELNELLDRLASSENRQEKTSTLSDLIRKTNAQEMKWIIMIILKDLKLGISEKSIFHEFHPDAEDLFNVTCDLKLVCEKLRDRSQRHKRQDIEVGKAVRPQLALRVSNAAAAWKKLHGKEVVVECKFDGDRIQIHKNGASVNFFSRNFLDHPEYKHGMSDVIRENILVDRCIVDGEMLVWDTSAGRFAEFGSNQEIAKAAKEGLATDRQLCCILALLLVFYTTQAWQSLEPETTGNAQSTLYVSDVAFDILYVGDTSVIHRTLKERQQLLRRVIKPVVGRLEILVPNGGLNSHRPAGEPCWSLIVNDVDSVERFFKETIENRDEGIVLKDLGSKWEPGDRSGKWLKLKPEYVRAGSDLDVLIIGGYYGSGRRGGEVSQFLVGLADQTDPDAHPRRFVSFCRVGTGLSDEELNAVVTKLKPYLRKYEYPKKAPPSFYKVTNNSKERPDVWVESPEKSIILSITSDIRTIRSEVFAAPYSLRFPRIDRVRYDKPWHECLDVQSFVELVHSSNGTTQRATDSAVLQDEKPQCTKLSRGIKKKTSVVPTHFIQTDVSQVTGRTSIFSDMIFYFVNVPSFHSLDSLHKMVVENGGTFSMNLHKSVTHCIASESKGIKFQAAKRHGDIIHYSWFSDCCSQKQLLPLQPKYFLFLSDASKEKLQEEIDEFGDSYYLDLNISDLKQILSNTSKVGDSNLVDHHKKKICPKEEWILFHGCCIYFHLPLQFLLASVPRENVKWKVPLELAMRRMKIEISVGGGHVAETLSHATHLVIVSCPQRNVDFDFLLNSFTETEKRLLLDKRLRIVKYQWLEDCFEKNQKLPEDSYSLKPQSCLGSSTGDSNEHDLSGDEYNRLDDPGKRDALHSDKGGIISKVASDHPSVINLPDRNRKRERGRPSGMSTQKGKSVVKQPRRTRSRMGNKPVKIYENESDENASLDDMEEDKVPRNPHNANSEKVKSKGRLGLNQPRRTRTQIRSKPAKVAGDGFEIGESSDEKTMNAEFELDVRNPEPVETKSMLIPETQSVEAEKDSQRSEKGKSVGLEFTENSKLGQIFDEVGFGSGSSRQQHIDRPGDTLDPIQAMLFNMVPILQKGENATPALDKVNAKSDDPKHDEAKIKVDCETIPVKKNKVSYKDLAKELLKDR